jgi:hypothetical protein
LRLSSFKEGKAESKARMEEVAKVALGGVEAVAIIGQQLPMKLILIPMVTSKEDRACITIIILAGLMGKTVLQA